MDRVLELDGRASAGIEVSLLWRPTTNALAVLVRNEAEGEMFAVSVDPVEALDVFRHPYAYRHRGDAVPT
jgi:hypothetical protein